MRRPPAGSSPTSRAEASSTFGVSSAARCASSRSCLRQLRETAGTSRPPGVAPITGSMMIGTPAGSIARASTTASTTWAEGISPTFTARTGKSSSTARTCVLMSSGPVGSMWRTPSAFCAVSATATGATCAPAASPARMSAASPARPVGSMPPMASTTGRVPSCRAASLSLPLLVSDCLLMPCAPATVHPPLPAGRGWPLPGHPPRRRRR